MTYVHKAKSDLPVRLGVTCLSFILLTSRTLAAVITPAPANFVLDGNVGEWNEETAVVRAPGAKAQYFIWFGRTRNGLVVAGRMRDTSLMFAKNASELGSKGRLELWLSVAEPFELPPATDDETSCMSAAPGDEPKKIACLEWLKGQTAYREQLIKLFTRMWRIAPGAAEEAYAMQAYNSLTELQRKDLRILRPSELPVRKFQVGSGGAVVFEILIPWAALPPVNRLNLEQVQLRLDIVDGTVRTSTGRDIGFAGQSTLPYVAVSPPIASRITPCGQPLVGRNTQGEDVPAFYFLNSSLEVNEAFFFEDPVSPNGGPFPERSDVSPIISHVKYFTQELDKGEVLCGPFMSYRKGSLIRQFSFELQPPGDQRSFIALTRFPVKRLDDGTRLIRYGPDTSAGVLWHHGIRVYSMRIFALSPSLQVRQALSLGAWSDGVAGYEIELSEDWRTVKEFREDNSGVWTAETFCLTGNSYRNCGKNPNSPPPRKRILTSEE